MSDKWEFNLVTLFGGDKHHVFNLNCQRQNKCLRLYHSCVKSNCVYPSVAELGCANFPRVLRRAFLLYETVSKRILTSNQFLRPLSSFFVLINCVVSLLTLQNSNCEKLATQITDSKIMIYCLFGVPHAFLSKEIICLS